MMISRTLYYWDIGQTVWLAYVKPTEAKIVSVEVRLHEDGEELTYFVKVIDPTHPFCGSTFPVPAKDCFSTRQEAAARAKQMLRKEEKE